MAPIMKHLSIFPHMMLLGLSALAPLTPQSSIYSKSKIIWHLCYCNFSYAHVNYLSDVVVVVENRK